MVGEDGVPIRYPDGRCHPCRGHSIVRRETPAGRGRIADFIRREEVDKLPASLAEAIVPAIPTLERLITAQAGGETGIGHTGSRGLGHRAGP
jgi:hypothetical protein